MNLTGILQEFHNVPQPPPAPPAAQAPTPAPAQAPAPDLEALDVSLDGFYPPTPHTKRYGFLVRGAIHERRRLVDWDAAFQAHAQCDSYTTTGHEGYLSAFVFETELAAHYMENASPKGYSGPCGAAWLWADFDGPEALADVRALERHLEGAGVDPAHVLVFFSGAKGFHIGVHAGLVGAEPGADFNAVARRFWQALVKDADAGTTFDASIFDRQRLLRAPNSKHPKTGLFKRHIPAADLDRLDLEEIRTLAAEPSEFTIPEGVRLHAGMAARWRAAQTPPAPRRAWTAPGAAPQRDRLNIGTLEFMRGGAPPGQRALRCFSAAADLAESGESFGRVLELLEGVALASGMTPQETRRQIRCGFNHGSTSHG